MMTKSFLLLSVLVLTGCHGFKSIKTVFTKTSPHEQYVESLKKAGLLNASMTQAWMAAGKRAFEDSVIIHVPFSESGFFKASAPEARSYRFTARDGQSIAIEAVSKSREEAQLFLDLFVLEGDKWERIAWADSTLALGYEFDEDRECILRLQPELLASAWYGIRIAVTPVLVNPVYGASNRSIRSLYGASRDNGRRLHEGVDIFAPRGTPVIAPADGYISRVGNSKLGGKVVWMRDRKRRHSYYFAHLDSQMVQPGMRVSRGHVLGLVGNTGNAKYTPPHLHFGIYEYGSKDPLYYIHRYEAAAAVEVDTAFVQQPFKVRAKKTALRTGPSAGLPAKADLRRDTYVNVIGQTEGWYRIELPDDTEGFLPKKYVVPLADGRRVKLDTAQVLLSQMRPDAAPIATLTEDTAIEILAHFERYRFVKTEEGTAGWLYN